MDSQEKRTEVNFGYIQGDKIYLSSYLDYPDRQLGVVKDTPEATEEYFTRKFALAVDKVDELEEAVKAHENKGSYLMKVLHMRTFLSEYDGLGDYPPLFARVDALEKYLRTLIEENRAKNLEIKEALIKDAEALKDSSEWRQTAEEMKTLKMNWVKTGSAHKDEEERLKVAFDDTVQQFFDRRQMHYDQKLEVAKEKAVSFRGIIERAESIKDAQNIKWASAEFKKMMAQWKELGTVPKIGEEDLWKEFQEIGDEFFARAKKAQRPRPQRSGGMPQRPGGRVERQNFAPSGPQAGGTTEDKLGLKAELVRKAEELADLEVQEAMNKAKKLQEEWQRSGMVPRHLKRDLQNRFNKAISLIYLKHAIFRSAIRNTFNYIEKPHREKLRAHISVLREFIRRDEAELIVFEQNLAHVNSSNSGQPMDKLLQSKHSSLLRKISHKKEYLIELMSELTEMSEQG